MSKQASERSSRLSGRISYICFMLLVFLCLLVGGVFWALAASGRRQSPGNRWTGSTPIDCGLQNSASIDLAGVETSIHHHHSATDHSCSCDPGSCGSDASSSCDSGASSCSCD